MLDDHPAASGRDRRADDRIRSERVHEKGHGDDVADGVDRTDLVEVDVVDGGHVHEGLGAGDAQERRVRAGTDRRIVDPEQQRRDVAPSPPRLVPGRGYRDPARTHVVHDHTFLRDGEPGDESVECGVESLE